MLDGCDALILECNHDTDMLAEGPYPASLKERVGGRLGHLNNEQAAGILGDMDSSSLQYLVAAHLSDKNNTAYLARDALTNALGCEQQDIQVACQEMGLGWCVIR
jgi:phosphoribosyl 1,2-cyclic phosphodiesterase